MEPFTTYKMSAEPERELFPPPMYCRALGGEETFEEYIPCTLEVVNPVHILRLCEILTNNASNELEVKINRYLKSVSGARSVFLINLLPASEEAVVQTLNDKILEKTIRLPLSEDTIDSLNEYENTCLPRDSEILDPQIVDVVAEVIEIKHHCVLVPVLSRPRKTKSQPNKNVYKETVLLVCFSYSPKDENYLIKLVDETFRYCLAILLNTYELEEEARQKRQCQSLLSVARRFFSHLSDLNDLLKEIMSEARKLTNAERCSLFLLDPDHVHLVARVFDGKANNEVKITKDKGIAGHVAVTGQMLNIKNAYEHPLFYKGVDEATGFKTRNILCFPICDENKIVGVAQLCNKKGGNFSYFDEEIANAFSIYCGLSMMHSLVYREIQNAHARTKLSNELLMYHMQVGDEDVARIIECRRLHTHPNFDKFNFSPRTLLYQESPCFVLKMFEDLGFLKMFCIKKEVVAKFFLFVKKGYRDPPYHNWMHAFSVTHFGYLCLKNFQLIENKYISPLEALAFFISCLCHDLDHRGTTNSFQERTETVLASLYSSEGSVMERHHLSQTLCTLNTEGCNFLESLDKENYVLCLDLIKDMILATDLATHFTMYARQLAMIQEGYDHDNPEHRYALICLLMTCADLSDQIKDWSVTKKVAQRIYEEFFTQGDLEKKMGRKPSDMMDRDKASIPDLQLSFLNDICLPVFKLLAILFPKGKPMVRAVKKNIMCWETAKCVFDKMTLEGKSSMEILTSTDLETDVKAILDTM